MNTGKRSKVQVEKDHCKIAELYCKGWFQYQIADYLNDREDNPEGYSISKQTVCDDLKKIRETWKASALLNFNERLSEEVAKIDNLERMFHEAYLKSMEDEISTKTVGYQEEGKGKKGKDQEEGTGKPFKMIMEQTKKNSLEGNIRCLQGILNCIETRCKLLGLMTEKIDLTSGGKKIEGNAIVLPANYINEDLPTFDKERMELLIEEAQKGERQTDD